MRGQERGGVRSAVGGRVCRSRLPVLRPVPDSPREGSGLCGRKVGPTLRPRGLEMDPGASASPRGGQRAVPPSGTALRADRHPGTPPLLRGGTRLEGHPRGADRDRRLLRGFPDGQRPAVPCVGPVDPQRTGPLPEAGGSYRADARRRPPGPLLPGSPVRTLRPGSPTIAPGVHPDERAATGGWIGTGAGAGVEDAPASVVTVRTPSRVGRRRPAPVAPTRRGGPPRRG